MKKIPVSYLPLILGVIVLGMPACSKKAVRSGGDMQALQDETAKGGGSKDGTGSSFPDTSFSGRNESNNLRGLDRNPSEERLGGHAGNTGSPGGVGHANAMVAKADSGAVARQLAEIRAVSPSRSRWTPTPSSPSCRGGASRRCRRGGRFSSGTSRGPRCAGCARSTPPSRTWIPSSRTCAKSSPDPGPEGPFHLISIFLHTRWRTLHESLSLSG